MLFRFLKDRKSQSVACSSVHFDYQTSVCVAGLGTAGVMAFIAAAEQGADVIGIERMSSGGGVGVNASVWDYYSGTGGGLFERIDRQCRALLPCGFADSQVQENIESIPAAVRECVLDQQLSEYENGTVFFNTSVLGVYLRQNRSVCGIKVLTANGTINIGAQVVIDATGDASVCRMAGCTMLPMRLWDGKGMRYSKTVGFSEGNKIRGVWRGYGYLQGFNSWQYSKQVLTDSAKEPALIAEYGEKRMIFNSKMIGERETSCVETEAVYTFKEYAEHKKASEPVFYSFGPLDNTNHDIAFENTLQQDWRMLSTMYNYGFSVGIPMKTMISKNIGGLVISGKNIGLGHDLIASVRMKKSMQKAGEAAGTLAYLAASKKINPVEVNYEELSKILEKTGCLNAENDIGICNIHSGKRVSFPKSAVEYQSALSQTCAGVAIWQIRHNGTDEIYALLKNWLKSPNAVLRRNSAIALGVCGYRESIEVLHEIINSPPVLYEPHEEPHWYPEYSKAICLLGRLRDEGCTEKLFEMLNTGAGDIVHNLKTHMFYPTTEDYAFQFCSTAIVSLLQIADKNKTIYGRLERWANQIADTLPERLKPLKMTVLSKIKDGGK